jgi:hypothetical protein
MLNPAVLCRYITIFVKIFEPYNALKGNFSKTFTGLEISLSPCVSVGMSSKFHSHGLIDPNFLQI